jgi:hypothetical protein
MSGARGRKDDHHSREGVPARGVAKTGKSVELGFDLAIFDERDDQRMQSLTVLPDGGGT